MTDLHSSWRSTEESPKEIPVPVHVTTTAPAPKPVAPVETSHVRIDPSMKGSMKFAAITGVGLVTLSVITFYFGVDFLRASLSDSIQEKFVVITTDDTFEPNELIVHPGDTITVENQNANPQVIKDQDDMFPVQVLQPGDSHSYNIPLGIEDGSFVFFSETMPEDSTLTITVQSQSISQASSEPENTDVLIPSFDQMADEPEEPIIPALPLAVSSQSSVQTINENQNDIPADPFDGSAKIQTNPYTVGNKQTPGSNATLHGGAPLKTPRSIQNTETGPATWLLSAIALIAVCGVYLKQKYVHNS